MNTATTFDRYGAPAIAAPLDARLAFVRRTYMHVAAAVAGMIGISWALFTAGISERVLQWAASGRGPMIFMALGLMALGVLAQVMARPGRSAAAQYTGLVVYVAAMTFYVSPLLALAVRYFPGVLTQAAALTVVLFGALTAFVLTTKKDLTFLGPVLGIAGLALLAVFVISMFWGGPMLGLIYTAGAIVLMCGAILYETSNVLHQYRTDEHVGAALTLFGSIAILFLQILSLLMQLAGRRE